MESYQQGFLFVELSNPPPTFKQIFMKQQVTTTVSLINLIPIFFM